VIVYDLPASTPAVGYDSIAAPNTAVKKVRIVYTILASRYFAIFESMSGGKIEPNPARLKSTTLKEYREG
jgi:hypothetical protein